MAIGCVQATRLSLAALGGHATAAERLELEAHLAGCARCSAEHAALAPVRRLRETEPDELSGPARERVRRELFARPLGAAAPARRLRWPLGAAAALAAAAGIALWLSAPPSSPVVLGGDVVVRPAAATADVATALELRSERSGEVELGGARTTLARATDIVWRRDRRSVELRAGSLTVDVEHRPGQHFEVRTPRFVVEVLGTRFSVDMAGVRTERGTVRVLAVDGGVIAYVEAGQSWHVPAAASTPAPAPVPGATGERAPAPPAPPREDPPVVAAAPRPSPVEETPAARLARARRALARGNAVEARRAVEPAFRLGREIAAEARALYAESFLIEGRYADAIDGYQLLIRDFPSTPQAESALYAVAQLESEHGRTAEARAALTRYLDRYPRGRFAKEAAERLARLPPPR